MDGYRGTVDVGSRQAKWLREGVTAAWRVLVCHNRQRCDGGSGVRGKEDWGHAVMPSLLNCSMYHAVLALRGVLPTLIRNLQIYNQDTATLR